MSDLITQTLRITRRTKCREDGTQDVLFEEVDPKTGEVLRSYYHEMMGSYVRVLFDNEEPEGV